MTTAHDHIAFRSEERTEAYLPGTGLAVWGVVWIAESYGGDVDATATHLGIDCALVQEALDYAAEHTAEIGVQIHDHVSWSEEDIKRAFPHVRIVTYDSETGELLPS